MRRPLHLLALASVVLTTIAATPGAPDARWRSQTLAWRAARENGLKAPDSWLTLAGLYWLHPGDNTVGSAGNNGIRLGSSAPARLGILRVNQDGVRLLPPAEGFPKTLSLAGKPAHEALVSSDQEPPVLSSGSLSLLVIHRGDRYALRVKDADSPTRRDFRGLHWYPLNAHFRVEAEWVPWHPPHQERIPTVIGTTLHLPVPGVARFTLDGRSFELEPVIEEPGSHQLFFILRDTSSRSGSYGAGRFLYADFPDHGLDQPGHLVLDFNRLQNPPCAYTPYATCPLPPEKNRLQVALPVGEKRYSH